MYMDVKINALIPYWCRAVAVQSYEYCDGTILVCSYWGKKKQIPYWMADASVGRHLKNLSKKYSRILTLMQEME